MRMGALGSGVLALGVGYPIQSAVEAENRYIYGGSASIPGGAGGQLPSAQGDTLDLVTWVRQPRYGIRKGSAGIPGKAGGKLPTAHEYTLYDLEHTLLEDPNIYRTSLHKGSAWTSGFKGGMMPSALQGSTLPKEGFGLGTPALGAIGAPLFTGLVAIPLQAAATWVGFHTGSKETGWLSAAGYVVGVMGAIGTLASVIDLLGRT